MDILTTRENGILIVTLTGRMDADGTRKFQETCGRWHATSVILDLCQLDYLSSSALREFLRLKREIDRKGKKLVLAGGSGLVDRILGICGFGDVFPRYLSVQEALGTIAAGTGPVAAR